jgi:hypothetical protein
MSGDALLEVEWNFFSRNDFSLQISSLNSRPCVERSVETTSSRSLSGDELLQLLENSC